MRDMEDAPQRDSGNQIPKSARPAACDVENEEREKPTARRASLPEASTHHRNPLPLGGPLWFSSATLWCAVTWVHDPLCGAESTPAYKIMSISFRPTIRRPVGKKDRHQNVSPVSLSLFGNRRERIGISNSPPCIYSGNFNVRRVTEFPVQGFAWL